MDWKKRSNRKNELMRCCCWSWQYSLSSLCLVLIYSRNDKRFQTSSPFSTFRFAQESCFFISIWCLHLMSDSDAVNVTLAESINKIVWLMAQRLISLAKRVCFGFNERKQIILFCWFSQTIQVWIKKKKSPTQSFLNSKNGRVDQKDSLENYMLPHSFDNSVYDLLPWCSLIL